MNLNRKEAEPLIDRHSVEAIVRISGPPEDAMGEMDCVLCAAMITREPYFAVMIRGGPTWLTCGDCVAALTGRSEYSSTNLERFVRVKLALPKVGSLLMAAWRKGRGLIRGKAHPPCCD